MRLGTYDDPFAPLPTASDMNAMVRPQVQSALIAQGLPPVLTPDNVAQPLPDITLALEPVALPCGPWAAINGWIRDNAVLAAVLLAGGFVVAWRSKHG